MRIPLCFSFWWLIPAFWVLCYTLNNCLAIYQSFSYLGGHFIWPRKCTSTDVTLPLFDMSFKCYSTWIFSSFLCKDLNIYLFCPILLVSQCTLLRLCCCMLFFPQNYRTTIIFVICWAHKSPLEGAVDLGWDLRKFPGS